jgi:cell shape-determining protein MreC
MIVTITKEMIYIGLIALLLILQIYQTRRIEKNKKDIDALWNQMQSLVLSIASALDQLEKKIDENQDKK